MAEIGRDALKVGLHVTKGPGADPDSPKAPSSGELEALRAKLDRILTVPAESSTAARGASTP